jgi:hypothetical protein
VTVLSGRFGEALAFATARHAGQVRHNTRTPYVGHLLATCAIVLEEGGDEDLAVAALLHDVLEDRPTPRAEVRQRFGAAVYQVVDDCTDADFHQRRTLPWRERKERHLARMRTYDARSLLVIAADKVSSLQSIDDDLVRYGVGVLGGRGPDLLWTYRETLAAVTPALAGRAVTRRLHLLVGAVAAALGPSRGRG